MSRSSETFLVYFRNLFCVLSPSMLLLYSLIYRTVRGNLHDLGFWRNPKIFSTPWLASLVGGGSQEVIIFGGNQVNLYPGDSTISILRPIQETFTGSLVCNHNVVGVCVCARASFTINVVFFLEGRRLQFRIKLGHLWR